MDTNTCNVCGKKAIYKCSNCKQVPYCSKECQRLDWHEHKKICIKKFDSEEKKFGVKNAFECPVCFDTKIESNVYPMCNHRICIDCDKEWGKQKKENKTICPYCGTNNNKITNDDMLKTIDRLLKSENLLDKYGAQIRILDLLQQQWSSSSKEDKIIIKTDALKRIEAIKSSYGSSYIHHPQLAEFENFFKTAKIDGGRKRSKRKSKSRKRKSRKRKSKSKKRSSRRF